MNTQISPKTLIGPEPRPMVVRPNVATQEPARGPDPRPIKHPHHGNVESGEKPGRSHVRRALNHVVREIRHAIKDEVKASNLDLETIGSIRELQRDFRSNLHGVFLNSGNDRKQVLEGMIEALQDLAAGLRALGEQDPKLDEVTPELESASPGTLVDLSV